MKTLLTPTPLIAIEIPENASKPYISASNHPCYQLPWGWKDVACKELLIGEHEILGTVDKGVIDFDCEPYVEKIDDAYIKRFWCYEDNCYDWLTAEESFISLIQKHSLSLDKKYLIIKPKN